MPKNTGKAALPPQIDYPRRLLYRLMDIKTAYWSISVNGGPATHIVKDIRTGVCDVVDSNQESSPRTPQCDKNNQQQRISPK